MQQFQRNVSGQKALTFRPAREKCTSLSPRATSLQCLGPVGLSEPSTLRSSSGRVKLSIGHVLTDHLRTQDWRLHWEPKYKPRLEQVSLLGKNVAHQDHVMRSLGQLEVSIAPVARCALQLEGLKGPH